MSATRPSASSSKTASSELRRELTARLLARQGELERATLARAYGVSDPAAVDDPQYAGRLRAAVGAALSYGISAIQDLSERPPPVPPELLAQARHAARNGVALETVLRRYFAGYTLLGDFVAETVEEAPFCVPGTELRQIWRAEAALFDRLISAVADEYADEQAGRPHTTEQRRAERVRRLLAGELIDTDAIEYELDTWHIGAVAVGPGAAVALRALAAKIDSRLLLVCPDEQTVWAWFGGRRNLHADEVMFAAAPDWPGEACLAFGDSGRGVAGWRLTHRQAAAAIPVAVRGVSNLVHYVNVALLASALRDEVLAGSLQEMFWVPLTKEGSGVEVMRETLQAYFAAERNVSAAAAALGVSRPTVKSRLEKIEERIGRPLGSCAAEMETVLRLRELVEGASGHTFNSGS
jgi:hypothetical protein